MIAAAQRCAAARRDDKTSERYGEPFARETPLAKIQRPRPVANVTNYDFPGVNLNAWGLFLRAYQVVTEEIDGELWRKHRLSLSQFAMLYQLERGGGRQSGIDLARGALMTQSRVTRFVDRLQKRGWLDRETSADDGRVTVVVLTAAGYAGYEAALVTFVEGYERHFKSLIPEKLKPGFLQVLTGLFNQEPTPAKARNLVGNRNKTAPSEE